MSDSQKVQMKTGIENNFVRCFSGEVKKKSFAMINT